MNELLESIIEQENCFDFYEEWLQIEDYELKILILTSILADNNLAYRGTLADICEWFGVKSYNRTNQKIRKAIEELNNNGYLDYMLKGRTWTLSISNKGLKQKNIVRIRKAWVSAIRKYKKDNAITVDWIKILKVFVYLYSRKCSSLLTLTTIANDLKISSSQVSKAIKAICNCDLSGIKVLKETVKEKYETSNNIYYYNLGTDVRIIIMFE